MRSTADDNNRGDNEENQPEEEAEHDGHTNKCQEPHRGQAPQQYRSLHQDRSSVSDVKNEAHALRSGFQQNHVLPCNRTTCSHS